LVKKIKDLKKEAKGLIKKYWVITKEKASDPNEVAHIFLQII